MKNENKLRKEVMQWLQQHTIHMLSDISESPYTNKAGLLPFVRTTAGLEFLLMRPEAEHPELEPPRLQICKGTRMGYAGKKWKDLPKELKSEQFTEMESLACTALREAIEEIGIILDTISSLWDAGQVIFASSKSGTPKTMHLFVAELTHKESLLPEQEIEKSTIERKWMNSEEIAMHARKDHALIINQVQSHLKSFI